MKLGGRTVLITGASKGIGLSVAQWFGREGCHLRLAARSKALLDEAAAAIRKESGVDVQTLALDLSQDAARRSMMEAWPEPATGHARCGAGSTKTGPVKGKLSKIGKKLIELGHAS